MIRRLLSGDAGAAQNHPLVFKHSGALDGLRAIAILIVFLGHSGISKAIPGGLGVTVFFFLSGYLISSLIRVDLINMGSVDLKDFYIKRFFRICPPLWISMAIIFVLNLFLLIRTEYSISGILSQAFFVSNYYDYFLRHPDLSIGGLPMPLWSLAVEEHFYMLFPFFVIFSHKYIKSIPMYMQLIILCGFAVLIRAFFVLHLKDSSSTYYLSQTRYDSILWGAVLAFKSNPLIDRTGARTSKIKVIIFCACVVVLVGTLPIKSIFFREVIRYTVQSLCLYGIFSYLLENPLSVFSRILSTAPFRVVARYSYTLYLVHYFIIYIARTWTPRIWLSALVAFAISMIYAAIIHYVVEKPSFAIRNRIIKRRQSLAV